VSRLAEATWPEAGRGGALVVPLGATEQHGPHLPLGTDTMIVEALLKRFEEARPGAWISPAVAIAASGEHSGFPGTLSIGGRALAELLVELGRSADHFDRIYFVNWHGGNATAIDEAVARLNEEGRVAGRWRPEPDWAGHDLHAGWVETSMMLAIHPGLVRREAAEAGTESRSPGTLARLRAEGVGAVSPNGVLGDPEGASAADGRRLLAGLAECLVADFDRFACPRS